MPNKILRIIKELNFTVLSIINKDKEILHSGLLQDLLNSTKKNLNLNLVDVGAKKLKN